MTKKSKATQAAVIKPTTIEDLQSAEAYVLRNLEDMVAKGRTAVAELFAKVEKAGIGELQYQAGWGNAVTEDYRAMLASRILADIKEGHPLLDALTYAKSQCERTALAGQPSSTSHFSNAVEGERQRVSLALMGTLGWWCSHIKQVRAEIEVL